MDAEELKTKYSHDVLSYYVPRCRKLLYLLSYVNQKYSTDADVKRIKAGLAKALLAQIAKPIPVNVPAYCLKSLHVALYHQCVVSEPIKAKDNLYDEFVGLSGAWKRVVLGLDDAETQLDFLFTGFSRIGGYINFQQHTLERLSDFVCPLCMLDGVVSDIGWTDYVCPQSVPSETTSSIISKRGLDPSRQAGACEHVLSNQKTIYDKLFL